MNTISFNIYNNIMISLIKLLSNPNRTDLFNKEMDKLLDLTKLENTNLLNICDFSKLFSKLSDQELLQSLKFDSFGDSLIHVCLGNMLICNSPLDQICIFLDNIRSVNVNIGDRESLTEGYSKLNPLLFACSQNNFELVRLLVEKYNANIESLSYNNTTPIMFSAQNGYFKITKYLYDLGAKLYTPQYHIRTFATTTMWEIISIWEEEKQRKCDSNQDLNQDLKHSYDKLKSEYDNLQQKYDHITKNLAILVK